MGAGNVRGCIIRGAALRTAVIDGRKLIGSHCHRSVEARPSNRIVQHLRGAHCACGRISAVFRPIWIQT
jgi:hypothetical protein